MILYINLVNFYDTRDLKFVQNNYYFVIYQNQRVITNGIINDSSLKKFQTIYISKYETFLFKNQNRMFIYGDIPNLIKIAGECGFIAIRGKNYDIYE